MDKKLWLKGLLASAICTLAIPANAGLFGNEVTINDQDPIYAGSETNEDNEAEPGMVQSQVWDLEGFFIEGSTLTMVGGYDFWDGQYSSQAPGDNNFSSGDLFISVGKPLFGKGDIENGGSNGNVDVLNSYGYNYVLDVDWDTATWDLYSIDENDTVVTSYYRQNYQSNPWQYNAVGESLASGSVGYEDQTFTDAETGKSGWGTNTHYAASFDLSAIYAQLAGDETLYAHFTMECGNDNLMGQWTVPEPATFALFGVGIAGLWLSRRRQTASAQAA